MKKILLPILLICMNLSVFSQTVVYNSNLIGQKLGLSDGSSEYTIKVVTEDDMVTTFFYFNDKQLKKVETNESGIYKLVKTTENNKITTESYKNNVPIKIIKDDEVTTYTYDCGKLITKVKKIGGRSQIFERYYYSGDEFVAVFRNINGTMEYSVFENKENPRLFLSTDNKFTEINVHNTLLTSNLYEGENLLSFNDATLADDGSMMIKTTKDGEIHDEYYDVDGNLYRENVLDGDVVIKTSTFEYDDFKNVVKLIENEFANKEEGESSMRTTFYKEGKIQKIVFQEGDVIVSTSVFDKYGKKIETLYKDGLKYCTVTYNFDGKKILDVQYEKR